MSKPVIALDLDDTLFGHFGCLKDWYNKSYGTKLTLADNHPFSARHWGTKELQIATLKRWNAATVEEAVKRVHQFFETDAFKSAKPYDDAVRVLRKLAKTHDVIVVTARDVVLEDFTKQWLAAHFGGHIRESHFTARYSLHGKARSKTEVLKGIRAAYVIDDDLALCTEAAEAGVSAIVFGHYPWNETEKLPAGVSRCADWLAVEAFFDGR